MLKIQRLEAPILGVAWHFIDESWALKFIPIAHLNPRNASRIGEQVSCIVDELLNKSTIIGYNKIQKHNITTENELTTALAVDLSTNYVWDIRCVVNTLTLCINHALQDQMSSWSSYLSFINELKNHFNKHQKAAMLCNKNIWRMELQKTAFIDFIKTYKKDGAQSWDPCCHLLR